MTNVPMPTHFSHSTLYLCDTCPAALAAKLRGEPAVASQAAEEGKQLHAAIARYAEGCWQRGARRDTEAANYLAAAYPDAVARGLRSFAEQMRWPWDKADAEECPVEVPWEVALPNGARFRGRTDLVYTDRGALKGNVFADSEDQCVIVDWKLHRWGEWFGAEVPKQLLTYAWARQQQVPEDKEFRLLLGAPGWSGQWAMRQWDFGGRLSVMVGDVSVPVGDWLAARVDRILAEQDWEPKPGRDTCPRCFYRAACPLRDTDTVREFCDRDAEAIAGEAAYHKAQAADANKLLQGRAKANGGAVYIGGKPWGDKGKTSYKLRDEFAARDRAAQAGHDLEALRGGWGKKQVEKAISDGWQSPEDWELVRSGSNWGYLSEEDEDSE